ncbi:MAG TPA: hypothetical protein VFV50_08150 [Bdellovibrionales bacterium]|nr:hypothetical protein [Bdellovibrionales bacterium]
MTTKKSANIDRREFLAKSSWILGGLGLSPLLQTEIGQYVLRNLLPQAQAATGTTNRVVEICLRAGAPLMNLVTSASYVPSVTNTVPNSTNFHSDFTQIQTLPTSNGQNVYLASVGAPLAPYAENIAYSQGVMRPDGHTGLWSTRAGGNPVDDANIAMGTPAVPAVFNAARSTLGSRLGGVNFNSSGGAVVNSLNGNADLSRVSTTGTDNGSMNNDDFVRMFGPKTLRLSNAERDAILTAVERLNVAQADRLRRRLDVATVNEAKVASEQSLVLMREDLKTVITNQYINMRDTMGFNVTPPRGMGYPLTKALALTAIGFERNLMASSQIVMDITDFHGFNSTDRSGNLLPAQVAAHLANSLRPFLDYLRATQDPMNPGTTLFDNTLVSISTEFWRDLELAVNMDNGDGGAMGFLFIGGNVRGGAYGNVNLNGGFRAQGFNPATGMTADGLIHPSSVYYTTLLALGYSQATARMEMNSRFGAQTQPLLAVLRNPVS